MLLSKKTKDFLFGILDICPDDIHYDRITGHIEIPTFTITCNCNGLYRHFASMSIGSFTGFKDKIFIVYKPTIKKVLKYDVITLVLESANKLQITINMHMSKCGWMADVTVRNHNKMWRWAERYQNNKLVRTFSTNYKEYSLTKFEIA